MRQKVPFAEDVVGEPQEETGFTNRGVTDEEEFEEVIVVLT